MRKDKGFTLLEILITILLIAAGFAFILQAASIGIFAGGENESELVAVNLAQEKMEDMRNKIYANVTLETKTAVPGFSAFKREVVIDIPHSNLKQVSVNVYWFVKDKEENVGLVTYVSNI